MYFLLLIACHADPLDAARDRVDTFLDDHPRGSAVVQVAVGGPELVGVIGDRWGGDSLGAHLSECVIADGAEIDVELILEPGHFPWQVRSEPETDAERCAADRLARFPFAEPLRRAARDLVHVRWRPGQAAAELTVREGPAPSGIPVGLRALAPPYFRRAADGDALVPGEDLVVDEGRVRVRVTGATVVGGVLDEPEGWARKLTCPADTLALVRTTLVFEDGSLESRDTWPETECVEDAAREARSWFGEQWVGGERLADAGNVVVVLDVPVGAW